MSQAEELLNGLTEEEMLAYTIDSSTEEHIVIGQDRIIIVPKSLRKIAVQYDHNIETVTFDCPRYWDGVDMSKMNIYINYLRADNKPGMFIAENVTVDDADPSVMHFTWTISRNITEIKGNITFLVCVKAVDSEGNETIHWNSDICRDCYVSEGLECSDIITEEYPDVISQLLGIVGINIDDALSLDSDYPVENRVITAKFNEMEYARKTGDENVLSNAKTYADEMDIKAISTSKTYTDERFDSLELQMALEDTDSLNEAKSYTDEQKSVIETNMASQDTSTLEEAKTYADDILNNEANARTKGDADTLDSANKYTNESISALKTELTGADSDILEQAKDYADDILNAEANARTKGDADTLTSTKAYTDTKISNEAGLRESGDDNTLRNAKTYTDEAITAEVTGRTKGDADTLAGAKTYVDEKMSAEVTARNKADTDILASGKSYTDEKIAGLINGAPSTLDTLKEVADAMSENADVVSALNEAIGTKAASKDLNTHVSNSENPHNVTKSQIGLGNVENKSSADIRGELTNDDVVNALGYTPPKTDTTYTEATTTESGLMSAGDKVKVGYLNNVTGDVQGQIDELVGNVEDLGGVVTDIQGEIDKINEEATSLNEEITDLGTVVNNLYTELRESDSILDGKITKLDEDINELGDTVAQGDMEILNEIDNLAIGSATGEYITVNNSSNASPVSLSISGKSSQVQLSGKNKIQDTIEITNNRVVLDVDLPADTYTLSVNNLTSTDTDYTTSTVFIYGENKDVELKALIFNRINTRQQQTFTVNEPIQRITFYASLSYVPSDGDSATWSGIQLELGDKATPYEPYCGGIPSPNPDYPQEIESVAKSGSVEVVSCGKNLWDMRELIGLTDNISKTIYRPVRLKPNVKYYIKRRYTDGSTITGSQQDTLLIDKVGDNRVSIRKITNSEYFILTEDEAEQINHVQYYTNGSGNKIHGEFYISEVNEYEPYQESRVTIPINPPRSLPNGVCDELIFNSDGSGKVIRRVGISIIDENYEGDKNDGVANNDNYLYFAWVNPKSTSVYCDSLSYKSLSQINGGDSLENVGYCIAASGACLFNVGYYLTRNLLGNGGVGIRTWLAENPITIQYELQTPVEESLTVEQVNALLSLKTFNNVTNLYSTDPLNPEMKLEYYKNTNVGQAISAVANRESERYSEMKTDISEIDLNTLATAEASGQHLTITDASNSPFNDFGMDGKSEQVQLSGKNLINPYMAKSKTENGVTFTVNPDKSITIKGTATDVTYLNLDHSTPVIYDELIASIGITDNTVVGLTVGYFVDDTNYINIKNMFSDTTFRFPENAIRHRIFLIIASGKTVDTTVYPMIRLATIEDGTYEPYCGGIPSPNPDYPQEIKSVGDVGSVEVVACGKNLLDVTEYPTQSSYGVTCTNNGNGTFTLNGTATGGDASFFLFYDLKDMIKVNEILKLVGCPSGGSKDTYRMTVHIDGTRWMDYRDIGNGLQIEAETISAIAISIVSGTTVNNLLFKPMLTTDLDATYDDFEPYHGTTQTLTLSNPLRSLPNGVCDTIERDGVGGLKVVRRVGKYVIDINGSIGTASNGNKRYVLTPSNRYPTPDSENYSQTNSLCDILSYDKTNYGYGTYHENPANIVLILGPDDNIDTFKEKLNGGEILYRLATPTEEPLTNLIDLQTYENITNVYTSDILQPNMRAGYYKDTNVGRACGELCSRINALIKG